MKFERLYSKIMKEENLAGSGDVFGPGSVNTGADRQGDHIYNPGDYRIAKGARPLLSRIKKLRMKKRKDKK